MLGRRKVVQRRDQIATSKLNAVRRQMLREQSANIIQRNFRAYVAVNFAVKQYKRREIEEARMPNLRSTSCPHAAEERDCLAMLMGGW